MRTSTLLVTITSVAATDVCKDTYNMCSDNNPATESVQYGKCVLTCTASETLCDEPAPCADGTVPTLDKCEPQCPYSPDEDQNELDCDENAYTPAPESEPESEPDHHTPAYGSTPEPESEPEAEPTEEPTAKPTPGPTTYTQSDSDDSDDSGAFLVSISLAAFLSATVAFVL